MAKIHLMGTALVAAALVAGCNKPADAESAPASEAAETAETATPVIDAAEAAPAEEAKDPNEVMISVNGKSITRGEIDKQVEEIVKKQEGKIPAEQLKYQKGMFAAQIVQAFVMDNAIVAKANELGYKADEKSMKTFEEKMLKEFAGRPDAPKSLEEFAEKLPFGKDFVMNQLKGQVAVENMIEGEITSKNKKDFSAEAQKIVDEAMAKNAAVPEEAAKAEKKIKELKEQLDATPDAEKAAKFAELAEANSDCPSGKRDKGSLGFFTHGQMVKEFDEAAFSLPVGKVSDIVKTQFGYHLILVTEKKAAVEAKGEQPAEPESVCASHILVKAPAEVQVPDVEELVKHLKSRDERAVISKYMMDILRKANIQAAEEYKFLLPPPEEPQVPVEKPAEK